jgi:hypothetical protein
VFIVSTTILSTLILHRFRSLRERTARYGRAEIYCRLEFSFKRATYLPSHRGIT